MKCRRVINPDFLDDTEVGALVRSAHADGVDVTVRSSRGATYCHQCDKPEPNRDDCAACGPEYDSLDLMERFAWESARSLDPVDALRWVNVAALCMRLRLALGGAPWPI